MKQYIFYIIIALFCFGCSDFLEEKSQDLVVVKNLDDLDEILLGDVYLPNRAVSAIGALSYASWLNFLDDDINTVVTRRGSDKWASTKWLYGRTTWLQDIGKPVDGGVFSSDNQPCEETYRRIHVINVILNELGDIATDTEQDKLKAERIKGECYFQRGLFYFFLANLYGEPYQPSKADTQLGIPLNLLYYVENDFHRNTMKEVYAQIVSDLNAAVELLTHSKQLHPSYRASRESALLLLSRVYLYMQDWTNAQKTASEFLKDNNVLTNIAGFMSNEFFMNKDNEEIIFSQSCQNLVNVLTAEGGDYCVTNDLYSLYDEKDYRKSLFFQMNYLTDSIAMGRKYSQKEGQMNPSDGFTLRIAEAYLNMAEAEAMLGHSEANDWLNRLRRFRIADYVDQQYVGEELVNEIRNERRKELAFEGHRWFDLRRYSVSEKYPYKKEIVRVYAYYSQDNEYKLNKVELYKLEKDDKAYLFRIPLCIRSYHPDMPDNIRPVRKPFSTMDSEGNITEKK